MIPPTARKRDKRSSDSDKSDSQATTLVAIAGDAEMFHDGDEAFARIDVDGHRVE